MSPLDYLHNAPRALIQLYEKGPLIDDHRPPHLPDTQQSLIKKLLCDKRMERVWNVIQKSVRSDEDYTFLWGAIVEAMRLARRGMVPQAVSREKYEAIARRAEKLAKLITDPPYPPPSGKPPPYSGDLDLKAYELLPNNVAKNLGAQSWATMTSEQRRVWAYSFLRGWPTMVELLDQLAIRARQCGSKKVSVVQRDRANIKAAIFSRELYNYFLRVNPRFAGWAAIYTIRLIAVGGKKGNGKTERAMILGSSGRKLPIRRR